MKKYRPPLNLEEAKELQRLSSIDLTDYSEADVREEFLVELCKILGYRKDLDYSVSREESFKLNPLFLSVGSSRIKLDYLCSLRKQYFWIIDAKEARCKDPNHPPEIELKEIAQAHFYSLHPEINSPYFVVSNGWFTNLYDRDKLDENCTPILSIAQEEIASRFLELDSFIGSTQILPKIKERILDQIEKVFTSEIRVERLDEFIKQVQDKAALSRPIVQKAAVATYYKNHSEDLPFEFLKTEDIASCVYSVFPFLRTRPEVSQVATILIDRIKNNHVHPDSSFREYLFFDRLTLRSPYGVNFWYYSSVLHFLFRAKKVGLTHVYYGSSTIEEILIEWIDLCLFHLSKKKELRYLWASERVYAKIIKQSILLFPEFRDNVHNLLGKELFYLPEEKISLLGPDPAKVVIDLVETSLNVFRSRFLNKFFDYTTNKFKEALAGQEYRRLLDVSENIDKSLGHQYEAIKKELGGSWGDLQSYEYLHFDRMGSAICDVLCWNEDQLSILTDSQRKRIKLLAEIDCTNFASELCDILLIDYSKTIDDKRKQELINRFYDPSIDQYNLQN